MDMSVVGGGPTVDIGGGGDAELESEVSLPIPKAPATFVPSNDRPTLSVKFWSTGVASPLKTPAENEIVILECVAIVAKYVIISGTCVFLIYIQIAFDKT